MLEHLAGVVSRESLPDNHLLRRFECGDPLVLQETAQARDVGPRLIRGHDHGTRTLPGAGIRQTDDGDLRDTRMVDEDVLDFFGRDVLAVSDDDVLDPSGDDEVVVIDPAGEIAGAEIPVVVERFDFVVGVQVTDQHLWAARMNLAAAGGIAAES